MSNNKIREERREEEEHILDYGDYIYEVLKKYSYRIGKYLILFSDLEQNLNDSLISCISENSNPLGSVVVKKLGFEARLDLFKVYHLQFINQMYTDEVRNKNLLRFNQLYKDMKNFQRFRNILAHANWMTLTKKGYVRTSIGNTKDGIVVFTMTKILPSDIDIEIKKIQKFPEDLYSFHEEINFCS